MVTEPQKMALLLLWVITVLHCICIVALPNKAFLDIRHCPGITMPLVVLGWGSAVHASPYGSLQPNVTSSIKLEVHNISQRCQRRMEHGNRGSTQKICEDRSSGSRDILTDSLTSWLQYSAPLLGWNNNVPFVPILY